MNNYKFNLISRIPFDIHADNIQEAINKAKDIAGIGFEYERGSFEKETPERWFYISYDGEIKVQLEPDWGVSNKTIIGHLAFSHIGFPSILYITEQLVPDQCKKRGTPVPSNIVLSFFHERAGL